MSAASSSTGDNLVTSTSRMDTSYFKCISCGKRYWQKKVLVRRSAKCRGVRFHPDGSRWACRAWRCRYNDQCAGADSACPICGAYKPPEFLPDQPAPAPDPAISSRSASFADPSLVPTNVPPDRLGTKLSASCSRGQPSNDSLREVSSSDLSIDLPKGTVTYLPCYDGVSERYLTEV